MLAVPEQPITMPLIVEKAPEESVFSMDLFKVKGLTVKPFNLAHELAKRVTNSKNKDATVLFVGEKGLGKSVSALGLLEGVTKEIHETQRNRSLMDICNWERDIAVIDPVNTLKTLNAERPKACAVLLDDMSISMDSRKHQTKENIESSEVWITMRTCRSVVIGTTVSGSLIDKRARENFTYVIKMKDDTRYDNIFENGRGIRMGDLRGVYKDALTDELKFPRIKLHENNNHVVISNILCFPPTQPLFKYYDGFRESEAERLRQKNQNKHNENKIIEMEEINTNKCPKCKSVRLYQRENGLIKCKNCGCIL